MSVLDAPAGDVAAYAADVRRALTGLTPEQVEDLTDDLEQALADAMADDHRSGAGVGLVGLFGTPSEYAAELRAAAGLEGAAHGSRRRPLGTLVGSVRAFGARLLTPLVAQPWWPSFASFARSLAPLWWVLRAWVMYLVLFGVVVGMPLAHGPVAWVLLLALVVISTQWGRGRWLGHKLVRGLWRAASAAALVATLPVAAYALSGSDGSSSPVYYESTPGDGVYVSGEQVSNLFVYDADGAPVVGAQVFDGQGRPVITATDESGYWYDERDGSTSRLVPATAADGGQRWNVFPLRGQQPSDVDPDVVGPVVDPAWPFAQATAVLTPRPAATDDAATSPTGPAAPDASVNPDADASAKPDTDASAKPDPNTSAKPGPTPSAGG